MTAVITDVHYRMSLALIRTLGEKGVRVVCCVNENEESPLGFFSKYCSQKHILPDENDLDALYKVCEDIFRSEKEKPVLFAVGAKTLHKFSKKDVFQRFQSVARMLIPSEEQLKQFNDKKTVAEIGKRNGVPVPVEYQAPYTDVAYPCIVKPACGEKFGLSAAKRYYIAKNREELDKYRDVFRGVTGEEPIVQQYIDGTGAGCSVLCKDGIVISAICHKRLREYPVTGGPSTCCRSFYSEEMAVYARKMVCDVKYNGIAMIEFKVDRNGKPYLLEINPRVWGTFPLVRVASSDFIQKWLESTISSNIEDGSRNTASMHASEPKYVDVSCYWNYKQKKMIYGFSDLVGAIGYAKQGKLHKSFGAFIDFLNPFVADGLWEWTDVRPGVVYLKSILKRRKK